MKRKEEIKTQAEEWWMNTPYNYKFQEAFIAGAEWADRTMIEKACKWLDCYIDNYLFIDAENKAGIRWDDFINDFRKAMKGDEE